MEKKRFQIEDEDEFYGKMDKEAKGSCCTCPILILFFIGLFTAAITGSYFLANHFITPKKSAKTTINQTNSNIKDLTNTKSVVLSDDDLQSMVKSSLLIPIENKYVNIESAGIVLTGKLPLSSAQPVTLVLIPAIDSGNVVIESINFKGVPATFQNEFSNLIKNKMADIINKAASKQSSMQLDDIKLYDGELKLEGH